MDSGVECHFTNAFHSTLTTFPPPPPAHRTQRADFPHWTHSKSCARPREAVPPAPVPPTAAKRLPGTRFTSACDAIRSFPNSTWG